MISAGDRRSLFVLVACGFLAGCGRGSAPAPASRGTPAPPQQVAPAPADAPARAAAADLAPRAKHPMPPPLPEDPVAGRRSTAQWQEHLEEEEHERRLGYDRRRLGQHRAVLASLHGLRQRYDRAKTNRAVASASAFCRDRAPELRRRITAIDPWGVSSKLLGDYGAMVDVLTGPYPAALLASIAGDPRQLHELRADWDRRVRKVQDWLAEAAASEDE